MQWDEGHRSNNVRDERGATQSGSGGMLWILFRIAAQFGWPGIIVFVVGLVCVGLFTGTAGLLGGGNTVATTSPGASEPQVEFVSFVLDDVQAAWTQQFAARGQTYRPTDLVLFTDSHTTGCGYGSAATGPFYCPTDGDVYLDLSFFEELDQRFGAPGDFAQAYVIAHEVGHHVQQQLGLSSSGGEGANGASVNFELQADCFAGVWASTAAQRGILDPGDAEEALGAASSIGDDRLQRQATGTVQPDAFTHGTSAQRMQWFQTGFKSGRMDACQPGK